MKIKKCEVQQCSGVRTAINPGAEVGYLIDGKKQTLKCCSSCAWMLMTAPRGTFEITADKRIVTIPAKPLIL